MANTEALLQEFPPVTTEAWEQAIRKDLKGADYNKKLIWKTDDGIAVKPYYRAEDLAGLDYLASAPGEFPYVRGTSASNQWHIREEIKGKDAAQANEGACEAVAAGAEEISFRQVPVSDKRGLDTLLAGLEKVPVHFEAATKELIELVLKAGKPACGSADWNPLTDPKVTASLLQAASGGFRPLAIPAHEYEESGATAVQEIGYAVAAGADFLAEMQQQGISIDRAAGAVVFTVAIGPTYFFQIAKLRALRMLWARVVESFGGNRTAAKAVIHARTSRWNQTVYDPYVNVLRGTTEAMSAAIGGVDSFTVTPFDALYKEPAEPSRRLARNTQILLKKEAQLERVADAGAGSYFVEVLTDSIARESWRLMQQIEAAGGYRKMAAMGAIQTELAKSMVIRQAALASRRQILLGTNHYPNLTETALDRLERDPSDGGRRSASAFEEIRLRTERHAASSGKRCRFLLAEIGDVKLRGARSNFSASFFGCGGFEVVTQTFKTVEEIAATPADVIVLCSADAEYAALAESLTAKLRQSGRTTPIVIAGYPAELLEQLKQAGVTDFVHIRSNVVEVLTSWQQRLGMGS